MDNRDSKLQELQELNKQYRANRVLIQNLATQIYFFEEISVELYNQLQDKEEECRLPDVYGKFAIIEDNEWVFLFDNEVLILAAYARYYPIENTWAADVNYATMDKNKSIDSADFCISRKTDYPKVWYVKQYGFITSEQAIAYANKLFDELVIELDILSSNSSNDEIDKE